ncbi:MAG: 1-acyl-sn-glycerol-3-phosphate acyltransferase [Ruminococcus sp.]|nr:1-acyl-sn-glycerol-3-phosphate acyltransferase [Ruminococcus sp.]
MYTFYKAARFILGPVFRLMYRPVIVGRENIPADGPAVIAGNHKHALDPVLIDISTRRVVRTLAKKALHDAWYGFLFRSAGTIPVDLHAKHNPAALEAAVEALRRGELVNVSPEAKRNYTDELLLPFKYGAAVMAARTGSVIVPYAIAGDYSLRPKHRLTVIFGRPVEAGSDPDDTNRRLYNEIASLLRKAMPEDELKRKHFTSYESWGEK